MAILCSTSQIIYTIFILFTFLLLFSYPSCDARESLTFNDSIRDSQKQTLISAGEKFELGFFTPQGSSNSKRYVGIWYYNLQPTTFVWVANREKPLFNTNGVLAISEDGELKLTDENNFVKWSTYSVKSSAKRKVTLMDSGNLVLSEEAGRGSSRVVWQSFEHPTDTFLPGMKMNEEMKLTSWRSPVDPATGNFTFKQNPERDDQYIIEQITNIYPYWTSEPSRNQLGNLFSFDEITPRISSLLSNFSTKTQESEINKGKNSSYNLTVPSYNASDFVYTRVLMNFTGQIQFLKLDDDSNTRTWNLIRSEPSDPCRVHKPCGNFASCNSENRMMCKCLPGFEPKSPTDWNSGDFSKGCSRKRVLDCKEDKADDFLHLTKIKVEKGEKVDAEDVEECRNKCLGDCCEAYSFMTNRYSTEPGCWIWVDELFNIQEYVLDESGDINVRVVTSDIELTKRDCEICGTTIIPYPLSTAPNCGDPLYRNFTCDNGQVYFQAAGVTYRVTNINREQRNFFINIDDSYNCTNTDEMANPRRLNQSSVFTVKNGCRYNKDGRLRELEVEWTPPLQPLCDTYDKCTDFTDSSCAAAEDGKKRCICNPPFHWDTENFKCTSEVKNSSSPKGSSQNQKLYVVFLGILATAVVISCIVLLVFYLRMKNEVNGRESESRGNIQGNQPVRLYDNERDITDLIHSGQFREEEKKGIDVPFFALESILAATDNFSEANKLGQGGFGPVYKGEFPGGEIAIKRLSKGSGQGLEEFKNEVLLIAKLQHRNLVRLLGYCVKGEEKMLLYEYMPNKSLDSFIFDRTLCLLLNWEIRLNIILGIARGLLYLHHDSRLRIIHRDLKTSNILLDEEMNPKISDFGLARIFGGKQTEASTTRVVGTYGYMSPEYALDGFFSIKSDVFSFGVVVLEIISGKRNTGFYQPEISLSLLGHAWKLWIENKALDLIDATIRETCNANELLRCVGVGLLCVQEDPNDRPTMSNVLFMLGSEAASLPNPKQPAFVVRRSSLSGTASSSKPELETVNELTSSLKIGR
ncbi:hypothetical protein UlMin_014287 [Ulmus minor]